MNNLRKTWSVLLAILMLTVSSLPAFGAEALYPQEMNFSNGGDVVVIGENGVLNNYWLSGKISGYSLSGIVDQNGNAWASAPEVTTDNDLAEVYRVDASSSLPGAYIARAFFSKPHDNKDYIVTLNATINSNHPDHSVTTASKVVSVYVPHTITIDANGGNYDGETELTLYTSGAESAHYKTTTTTLLTPTKDGYQFAGWELEGEGNLNDDGTVFAAGNGDATLTALWKSNHVHDYSVFVGFDWSDDYSSVNAILKCSEDEATIAEPLDVEVEETEGDCETATEILYSAYYSADDDDYFETKQVFISPKGHDYKFEDAVWADDYSGVTLTFRCSVCKNVMHQFLLADCVENEPDCKTAGSIIYSVQYSEDDIDFEDSKEVILPSTGHSFTNYVYNKDAKCGIDGTETAVCDYDCGETDTRTAKGTALTHSFTNYIYNKDAKCGIDGTETAVCDRCSVETDTRIALGTALNHIDSDNDGYCDRDGCGFDMQHNNRCPRCGKIHNSNIFDKIVGFFHKIIYVITHLFRK